VGKLVLWLVVIFAILFALRLLNTAKARTRDRERAGGASGPAALPMVRCSECGVYLPRADTRADGDAYRCTDAKCPNRQRG
jgi:uncharacterized protein